MFQRLTATVAIITLVCTTTLSLWGSEQSQRTRFISHRGESKDFPENTMAAFKAAVENGSDGFECDIYLTADNQIICSHDRNTKRIAGVDLDVTQTTAAELRKLDVGKWKGEQFEAEKMPLLAEILTLARDNFEIFVEIKDNAHIVPFIVKEIAAAPGATPERVLFISFNRAVIAAVREQLPAYRAYWLSSTRPRKDGTPGPTAEAIIEIAHNHNANGVDLQYSQEITSEYIKTIRDAGLEFHVWTVNNLENAQKLVALGVDSITSDCAVLLKKTICQEKKCCK